MCGIAGWSGVGSPPDLAEAGARLAHRGPDGTGFESGRGSTFSWSLAHTRLSIVDLSENAGEPMFNEDRTLCMVFNGEIYNHEDLRSICRARGHRFGSEMDGEVILHLWEDEGPQCLDRLDGIFALAMVDLASGGISLARDAVGVKPLFYMHDQKGLFFASELSGLRAAGADLGSPDIEGLAQFLTFLWIPSPVTPYSNARSLAPGSVLTQHADGSVGRHRYTGHLVPEPNDVALSSVEAAADALQQFLQSSVSRQLMADVPVGVAASGGIDSSLVWWAARDARLKAFTIEWPADASDENLHEDAAAVRSLEERFGHEVEYVPGHLHDPSIPASGDLFADPAFDLAADIARAARAKGVKVILSGQGADEIFGGYRRHSVVKHFHGPRRKGWGLLSRLPFPKAGGLTTEYAARVRRSVAAPSDFHAYLELCSYSTARQRARVLGCSEAEVSDEVVWQRHRAAYDLLSPTLSPLKKALAIDLNVYLPGLGLAYGDRAMMQHGVEMRVPWLSVDLVRWSFTLDDEALVGLRRRKLAPRLLAQRVLGADIANRPKRGFGAPTPPLQQPDASGRGFRQASYFERAARTLQRSGFID